MEYIVYPPGSEDIQPVRCGSNLLKYRVRFQPSSNEFLGWGIRAEVVGLQPDAIPNCETEVLAASVCVIYRLYAFCAFLMANWQRAWTS